MQLDPENWAAGLEQTMLIVLVLGRWLMPKGDMSRDQLSQLLMVYVGLGADILDIFDTFKEPEVKTNRAVIIMGLALFSWALMQFPLVLTQTSPPKAHLQPCLSQPGCPQRGLSQEGSVAVVEGLPGAPPSCYTPCCSSEVWSLLLTVGLQDGPFLIYRLYLMIRENVLNQLMIFFTCKNILVVLLEFYRIFVVQCEQQGEGCLGGLERCAMPWCQRAQEEEVEGEGRGQESGEQNCQTEEGGEVVEGDGEREGEEEEEGKREGSGEGEEDEEEGGKESGEQSCQTEVEVEGERQRIRSEGLPGVEPMMP